MITVEEALAICLRHAPVMPAEFRALEHAVGAFAAIDAFAADDYPRFHASAVDGYAVGDLHGPWLLAGRIAAGERLERGLGPGECARILTGAEVPAGSMAVLMQEHASIDAGMVALAKGALAAGANIRPQGEAFRTGELLVAKGARISPALIGILASAGVDEVMVSLEPRVGVVRTGGEFIRGAGSGGDGLIHSSNDRMLAAAIRQAWLVTDDAPYTAPDDRDALRSALQQAAAENDAVVTTGGVSVGDHDLIRPVLEELGAEIRFHGVRQKPGKPLLFATLGRTPVFGLPGNPRAVLVCWHAYVLPFLQAMQGAAAPGPVVERLPLAHAVQLKGDRAEFRAARVREGRVHLLPDEGSHMLTTLAGADALAYFPHHVRAAEAQDPVEVHYLPQP